MRSLQIRQWASKWPDISRGTGASAASKGASVCPLRALEEGIKDFDAALFEVTDVAGDDSEFVSECGSGDHAIFDWHGLAVAPQLGKQLGPRRGGCRVEVKDVYFFHADTEPLQEPIASGANLQQENAVFDFPKNHRIHGEFGFVGGGAGRAGPEGTDTFTRFRVKPPFGVALLTSGLKLLDFLVKCSIRINFMALFFSRKTASFIQFERSLFYQALSPILLLTKKDEIIVRANLNEIISSPNTGLFSITIVPNVILSLITAKVVTHIRLNDPDGVLIAQEELAVNLDWISGCDSIIYLNDFEYERPRKIAVFTHVYNPGPMLETWLKYYRKLVGGDNLYVLDHGSTDGTTEPLKGFHVIHVPRGPLDHVNMSKFCAYFQRFLLCNYDWVIHVDCDEFLVFPGGPEVLRRTIESLPLSGTLVPEVAVEIIHNSTKESPINFSLPLTSQRSYCFENKNFLKPSISSTPTTWGPGFHDCNDPTTRLEGLWMVHARHLDAPSSVTQNKAFRQQSQTALDRLYFNALCYDVDEASLRIAIDSKFREMSMQKMLMTLPEWVVGQF